MTRAASFAPERSEGGNYATRDTNKLYARQKSFDYHYYQFTRPNFCLSPRKKLIFNFEIKSPTLQNYKVTKYKFAPSLALKRTLRFPLAKRSCLTSLQPIRIKVANPFAALAFLVWPTRTRVLRRAVCHLAARIDNNSRSSAVEVLLVITVLAIVCLRACVSAICSTRTGPPCVSTPISTPKFGIKKLIWVKCPLKRDNEILEI